MKHRMNLPNRLTMLRILMIPVFLFFAARTEFFWQLCAAIVFGAACFTDTLDGRIARRQNLVTNFGKFADPIADKLLVMAALVVLVDQNRVPVWVCVTLLAREFIISGFRLVAVEGGRVIAAGKLGKIKTATQMVAILMILLLLPAQGAPLMGDFGVVISTLALYLATLMTVVSGIEYIWKNFDCIRDM